MAIDLSRVKGLCFDVDGTLSDTDDVWEGKLVTFFSRFPFLFRGGNPQPFSRRLLMALESPMNEIYHLLDRYSLDDNVARIYDRLSRNRKQKPASFRLMNGANELLELVHEKYPLTVVSARDETSTYRFLDEFYLTRHFRKIITSQTCEYTKPFPHPIRHAAETMGLPCEACLMIGDTTVDILAGKAAGAQTIGLLCGFGTEQELRKAGADLVLHDLLELREIFEVEYPH